MEISEVDWLLQNLNNQVSLFTYEVTFNNGILFKERDTSKGSYCLIDDDKYRTKDSEFLYGLAIYYKNQCRFLSRRKRAK